MLSVIFGVLVRARILNLVVTLLVGSGPLAMKVVRILVS